MALNGGLPGLGLGTGLGDPLGLGIAGLPSLMGMTDPALMLTVLSKRAVMTGAFESAPVAPIKMKSDQSGASAENDYFNALGYEA